MEKPDFNNKPKIEVEKTIQENERSLNFEEQESSKRETVTLEIGGKTIEAVKYYFEYPEHIQKETGILGYVRTVIPSEFVKTLKEIELKNGESDVGSEMDITYKLLDELSHKEYPTHCYNHVLAYWSDRTRHLEYFRQGFFKNKIYDLSVIEKESKHEIYPLSNANTLSGDNSELHGNFTVYDKESNMVSDKKIPIGHILKYKDDIDEGNKYAATSFGGLNLSPTDFFHTGPTKDTLGFGFPFELDNFMREYYEKALAEEVKQSIKNGSSDGLGLHEIMIRLAMDNDLKNIHINLSQSLNLILKDNGIESFSFTENDVQGVLKEVENHKKWSNGREYGTPFHSYLPIFIGNDKIPQLSWGHATYAHYFNDKGFNFFKFKHADHLPTKTEI